MDTSSASKLSTFSRGITLALSDDGKVGENDAPGLRQLAKDIGKPELVAVVDALESKTDIAGRKNRLKGSGYAASVVAFKPGKGAGFNNDHRSVVLGRPEGAGESQGSLHTLSLGQGGEITVKLGRPVTRGLVVFENAFKHPGGTSSDPGNVEVSADGVHWTRLQGQTGMSPVFLNSENRVSPRSRGAGGDRFSFADAGIPAGTAIQFVRIKDASTTSAAGSTTAGFDLDAVYGF